MALQPQLSAWVQGPQARLINGYDLDLELDLFTPLEFITSFLRIDLERNFLTCLRMSVRVKFKVILACMVCLQLN